MSQVSGNLSINNGAATPVAVTFAPERVSPDLTTFVDRTAGASAAYSRLAVAFSPANGKRTTNRIDVKFDLPIYSTVNGVITVTDIARFQGYFVIPGTADASTRANLAAFVANALDVTSIRGVIKDLDPLY